MSDATRSDEAVALSLLRRMIEADPDGRAGDSLVTEQGEVWLTLDPDEQYLWRRIEAGEA